MTSSQLNLTEDEAIARAVLVFDERDHEKPWTEDSALEYFDAGKAFRERFSSAHVLRYIEEVKRLREQKRLLFEENGRLLAEKESGLWDANHPIRAELSRLRADLEVARESLKDALVAMEALASTQATKGLGILGSTIVGPDAVKRLQTTLARLNGGKGDE